MGHARALLGLADPVACQAAAERVVEEGLSVRQVEQLVRVTTTTAAQAQASGDGDGGGRGPAFASIRELEANLRLFGAEVQVSERGGRGSLTVRFHSKGHFKQVIDQLDAAFRQATRLVMIPMDPHIESLRNPHPCLGLRLRCRVFAIVAQIRAGDVTQAPEQLAEQGVDG